MVKLRNLHIPLFAVLLSGFVTLFNQAHQYTVFSANSQETFVGTTGKSATIHRMHQEGTARLLAELLDLEEESDSENDRNTALLNADAFHPSTAVTKLSRHLFDLPASSWSDHHYTYKESCARIPLYKRVCVFRI